MSFFVPTNNWEGPVFGEYVKSIYGNISNETKNNININDLDLQNSLSASIPYTLNFDNVNYPDPATGCEKNFIATYQCGSSLDSPTKTININAPADGKLAYFNCDDETYKCKATILYLNDNGRLTLLTWDGKKILWDSLSDGKFPLASQFTPASETTNIKDNTPLTIPEYAGDHKPHPSVDVGLGGGPGRRYSHPYLVSGQMLEYGQWIGSQSGTCRLIMGTPENPYALQVVTTILGCNSLDKPTNTLTGNTHLTDLGCWGDSGSRALSIYNGNVQRKEQCAEIANTQGTNIFGLQYYGECWTGKPGDNYQKYGKSTKPCGDLGVDWQNHVYQIDGVGLDRVATRVYTIPNIGNENIGKTAYVNYQGQLQLYPDTNMTKYEKGFDEVGNYNLNGAKLGAPLESSSVEACKSNCLTSQQCAGFVFDSTRVRCQLLDKNFKKKQRIIDKNYQFYSRHKGVTGQDISCPIDTVNETAGFWSSMVYNPTNMTPTSKCGLAKFTENERSKVATDLIDVNDNLQYKDKNGTVLKIKFPEAANGQHVRKTGFKYWYESLESKYGQLKNKIFNTTASIDNTFTELQESKQNLADWTGEQLQNLSAMNEDRDLNMMSQNYRHIMWSILAILIIMATMKMTKSVSKGSV